MNNIKKIAQEIIKQSNISLFKKVNNAFLKYFSTLTNSYYKTIKNINEGYCWVWAIIVSRHSNAKLCYDANTNHSFVKIGDKFYDAQQLNGVDDWRNLSTMKHFYRVQIRVDMDSGKMKSYDDLPNYGMKKDSDKLIDEKSLISKYKKEPSLVDKIFEEIEKYL